jgi:hypothetical protein
MARPIRIEYPGAVYHVTARGKERRKTFRDDKGCKCFLDTLVEAIGQFGLRLHGFCLMPNHYLLLVETPEANPGRLPSGKKSGVWKFRSGSGWAENAGLISLRPLVTRMAVPSPIFSNVCPRTRQFDGASRRSKLSTRNARLASRVEPLLVVECSRSNPH